MTAEWTSTITHEPLPPRPYRWRWYRRLLIRTHRYPWAPKYVWMQQSRRHWELFVRERELANAQRREIVKLNERIRELECHVVQQAEIMRDDHNRLCAGRE